MEKVKCVKCGSIGFTSSPEGARCEICGSGLEVIPMENEDHGLRKTPSAYLRRLLAGRKVANSENKRKGRIEILPIREICQNFL